MFIHDPDPDFQCGGSGMFITDPDFYPSRIPDPKTATNFIKVNIILVLEC
jgi:hypothetical protein